jgi:YHS domain-containing protein
LYKHSNRDVCTIVRERYVFAAICIDGIFVTITHSKKKKKMKTIIITCLTVLFSITLYAQSIHFSGKNGIAINGYDPVAYFLQQKAVEGKDTYRTEWSGSTWKFLSQSNLDSFKLAPAKYAPQYGGFCAYGTSENHLSPTDPKAFTIVQGKLYLNYNQDVKQLWIKDTTSRIIAADGYWPALNK